MCQAARSTVGSALADEPPTSATNVRAWLATRLADAGAAVASPLFAGLGRGSRPRPGGGQRSLLLSLFGVGTRGEAGCARWPRMELCPWLTECREGLQTIRKTALALTGRVQGAARDSQAQLIATVRAVLEQQLESSQFEVCVCVAWHGLTSPPVFSVAGTAPRLAGAAFRDGEFSAQPARSVQQRCGPAAIDSLMQSSWGRCSSSSQGLLSMWTRTPIATQRKPCRGRTPNVGPPKPTHS